MDEGSLESGPGTQAGDAGKSVELTRRNTAPFTAICTFVVLVIHYAVRVCGKWHIDLVQKMDDGIAYCCTDRGAQNSHPFRVRQKLGITAI